MQHNLAVRVCDILRDIRTTPLKRLPAASSAAPGSPGFDASAAPIESPAQFGGVLERKNTAAALTAALLEREFNAQQERRGAVAASPAVVQSVPLKLASGRGTSTKKSAADYAAELEEFVRAS
jgi:hypothetical protein